MLIIIIFDVEIDKMYIFALRFIQMGQC
jgi:hypothetical protein